MASEGYKDFVASTGLAAADLEDYCEAQGIMRFASASARDTALALIKTEGMFAYLKDVNTITVYSGTTWSTIGPVHGAWTAWSPALVQSVAVSSTSVAAYTRTGRSVQGYFENSATASGSASNVVTVSLPVPAVRSTVNTFIGAGKIFDASAGLEYPALLVLNSATTAKFMEVAPGAAARYLGATGATFVVALATGDGVDGQFAYEAAADA